MFLKGFAVKVLILRQNIMAIISFNLKNVVFNIPTGENSHANFISFFGYGIKVPWDFIIF